MPTDQSVATTLAAASHDVEGSLKCRRPPCSHLPLACASHLAPVVGGLLCGFQLVHLIQLLQTTAGAGQCLHFELLPLLPMLL